MAPLVACRVTVGLAGGVRAGDIVYVDPEDPWMASKIDVSRGPLVPLEAWPPPAVPEPIEGTPEEPQASSSGHETSTAERDLPAAED